MRRRMTLLVVLALGAGARSRLCARPSRVIGLTSPACPTASTPRACACGTSTSSRSTTSSPASCTSATRSTTSTTYDPALADPLAAHRSQLVDATFIVHAGEAHLIAVGAP